MPDKVDLAAAFASFDETWSPRIVAELNGQTVKIAKFEGAFDWHHHENEDELFWVVRGKVTIRLRDGDVTLGPGELYVVPRGVEHKPVADGVADVVMFEPASTLNTGNVRNERTREDLERL